MWLNYSFYILIVIAIYYIIVFVYWAGKSEQEVPEDERTKKVNYKAKNYSWHFTYIAVIIIAVLGTIFNLTLLQVAILIILSMWLSQFLFVIYFNRKGVLE
jgi:TRAP-type C4-dicarboxylate transport system permease large subunit